jgi:flagellar basal body rod protein FlgF
VKADRVLTKRDHVGLCPACRARIDAEVTVAVKVGDPVLGSDGKVEVPTESQVTKVSISHRCDGRQAETPPDL